MLYEAGGESRPVSGGAVNVGQRPDFPDSIVVYCVDVGSVPQKKFAWARGSKSGSQTAVTCGTDIDALVGIVATDLAAGEPVALGFECPLFVPVPHEAGRLGCKRPGEHDRAWAASAGAAALATGLVQAVWILRELRQATERLHLPVPVFMRLADFATQGAGLLLWEAFVSSDAKTGTHTGDAECAVRCFIEHVPKGECVVEMTEANTPVLSLIGSALLQTGWSTDLTLLNTPCLVVQPAGKAKTVQ